MGAKKLTSRLRDRGFELTDQQIRSQRSLLRAIDSRFGKPQKLASSGTYNISVTLNGFECHRQTWDSALQVDGAGDEIYLLAHVVRTKSDGTVLDAFSKRTSRIYGQVSVPTPVGGLVTIPDREPLPGVPQAGYGTAVVPFGGIRSGDRVPNPNTPWKRVNYFGKDEGGWPERLPMLLHARTGLPMDEITDEVLTIVPAVVESDGGQQAAGIASDLADAAAVLAPIVTTTLGGPVWLGALAKAAPAAIKSLISITGHPGDRVIGQSKVANGKFQFDATGLSVRLNPSELQLAASTMNPRGYGTGIYNFLFADSSDLGDGQYTAYIEVRFEFVPELM